MNQCNVVLWFLPCLFNASVMANFINSRITNSLIKWCITGVFVAIAGLFESSLPYFFGQAIQAAPFLLLGCFWAGYREKVETYMKQHRMWCGALGLLGMIPIALSGVTCNMLGASYTPCYPVLFVVAIWGIFCMYLFAFSIGHSRVLAWLGVNSLAIMLMHEPVKRIVIKVYSMLLGTTTDCLRESVLQSLVMTMLTLLVLVPFVWGVNRYVPFLLGKRKTVQKN